MCCGRVLGQLVTDTWDTQEPVPVLTHSVVTLPAWLSKIQRLTEVMRGVLGIPECRIWPR